MMRFNQRNSDIKEGKTVKTFKQLMEDVGLNEGKGMSELGKARDTEESDRDYIMQKHGKAIEKDPATGVKKAPTKVLRALHFWNMGQSGAGDHPAIKHIKAELADRKKK